MRKSLRTLKKYSHLLTNAIESPYSNGLIEGTHNTIKRMTHIGTLLMSHPKLSSG